MTLEKQDIDTILELYADGFSGHEISRETGFARRTIYKYIDAKDWNDYERQVKRYIRKCHKTEHGCWLVPQGMINPVSGYGTIRTVKDRIQKNAHRHIYETLRGPVPEGLILRHQCHLFGANQENKHCVNPDHLKIGTRQENAMDSVMSRNKYRKLTPHQVEEIRALKGKLKLKEVANKFGVSTKYVSDLQNGRLPKYHKQAMKKMRERTK